ncbi:MAG: phosphatidylcholine/phosphatidylserine synthase [Pseudomonadota bacterium]|nr:phosphatidylcholine/phosphatidylserine synthase [Pseudomonadota bacterium]
MRTPRLLEEASLHRFLPNILTILGLCAGMTAIRFATLGRWEAAVVAIAIAAVIDALDGGLARLLNAQSKFGAQLDSLSDVISFGVAPALINYLWTLQDIRGLGWVSALVLTVCAALRLARFNTRSVEADLPPWAKRFFTGVPVPAGAGLALMPILISLLIGEELAGTDHMVVRAWLGVYPYITTVWLIIIGGLMISRLPTFSIKDIRISHRMVLPVLVGAGLLAAAMATAPWLTLILCGLAYTASLPFSYHHFRKLQAREAGNGADIAPLHLAPVQTLAEEDGEHPGH